MWSALASRRPAAVLALALAAAAPLVAHAHCDRLDGPVAGAAREALESGRLETVAVWVGEEQQVELLAAFEMARGARDDGADAARLAERYLIETAVRLHRLAEGMSYDGVKPAGLPLPEDVRLGDRALETDDPAPVLAFLGNELEHRTRELFEHARATRARRDESLEAGREWVDAYVRYIVFVHGIEEAIAAGPVHGLAHAD